MFDNILEKKSFGPDAKAMTKEFFASVYTYMFIALLSSGVIAYYTASTGKVFEWFINTTTGSVSPLFYVVVFAPVGLGLLLQMAYNKLSMGLLLALFLVYSCLMGLSLSTLFIVYSLGDIVTTFFVTAGAFAGMAILGYTTKTDLSKMGSLLYMVFIGMFIAGILNFLVFESSMMSFVISILGVIVFTGLTAWEMQRLKYIAEDPALEGVQKKKLALIGGLMLYILFINLFVSLLRLLGGND